MMPRPRARSRPLEVARASKLAEEIAEIRHEGGEPMAVCSGIREWRAVLAQTREHSAWWPGGEETFCGVAVIIRRELRGAQVVATQDELNGLLLGDD